MTTAAMRRFDDTETIHSFHGKLTSTRNDDFRALRPLATATAVAAIKDDDFMDFGPWHP